MDRQLVIWSPDFDFPYQVFRCYGNFLYIINNNNNNNHVRKGKFFILTVCITFAHIRGPNRSWCKLNLHYKLRFGLPRE